MATTKIELREIRDFGTVFSDAFAFIKQEFKPLFRSVLLYAGIFILAGGIFTGLAYGRSSIWGAMFNQMNNPTAYYDNSRSVYGFFNINYFIALFCMIVSQASLVTVTACYMKLYKQKNNESPTPQEVWQMFSRYFFRVLIINIVFGLLMGIGFLFCLVPGFYFMTILAPMSFVVVMEDESSVSDVYSRCASLTKENFWMCFGLYFLLWLLAAACSGIVGTVIGIISGLISYFTTKDIGATVGLVYGILSVVTYFFYIIVYTGIGLNYFSLVEKLDGTGLLEKINEMGADEHND